MPDFTVARRGTDSSGRGIFATTYMWDWFTRVRASLPFGDEIVITQGAFMTMAGGGAAGSAGYHDSGGCFDLRVWNLTDLAVSQLVRRLRQYGAAAWHRDVAHGGFTDEHIHFVLGTDHPLSVGAASQWRDYINGGDGIGGRDYHWRPDPLVTTPPEEDWFDMATKDDLAAVLDNKLQPIVKRLDNLRDAGKRRNQRIMARLSEIAAEAKDDATAKQLRALRDEIAAAEEEEN